MEEKDLEQYKALMKEVEEVKTELGIETADTVLLLKIYDLLLDQRE